MATHSPYPDEPSLAVLWEEGYLAGIKDSQRDIDLISDLLSAAVEHIKQGHKP